MMDPSQCLLNKKFKAIFFDFGDTLAFNNQSFVEGLHKILRTININVSIERLQSVVRMADSGELVSERLKARDEKAYRAFRIKYYKYVLGLLGYPQQDNEYAEYLHNMIPYYHNTYLKPESLLVLSTLRKAGYKLGIVSNFCHALPRICRELGITDKVDFIVYSDDVGYEKPSPYIFKEALERASTAPEEAIHVGDSYVADVLGARAVGITPILVCEEDIYGDCIWINNLIDILRFLGIEFAGNLSEIK